MISLSIWSKDKNGVTSRDNQQWELFVLRKNFDQLGHLHHIPVVAFTQ